MSGQKRKAEEIYRNLEDEVKKLQEEVRQLKQEKEDIHIYNNRVAAQRLIDLQLHRIKIRELEEEQQKLLHDKNAAEEKAQELEMKFNMSEMLSEDLTHENAHLKAELDVARKRMSQHEKTGAADANTCVVCFEVFSDDNKVVVKHKSTNKSLNVGHILCLDCYKETAQKTKRCWCNAEVTDDCIMVYGN